MWTTGNRVRYERKGRYPSDVTDEEWALVKPHLPPERRVDRREVLNAILYVLATGGSWCQLPKDFPAKSTVHDYFIEWHCDGTLTRIHHALYTQARELASKDPVGTSARARKEGGASSTPPATMRVRKSRARIRSNSGNAPTR